MFNENWFDDNAQATLAGLVRSLDVDPVVHGVILEIGAWEGRSTVAIARATGRVVHTCDTWEGSAADNSKLNAEMRDVFATWSDNVAPFPYVFPHRMGWRDYVPTITSPVAMCFIDAEHTYREVHDNIVAVLPLLTPGGIMCGDDIGNMWVKRAVRELLTDFECDGPVWWWRKPC